jgi:uncharacterized protein
MSTKRSPAVRFSARPSLARLARAAVFPLVLALGAGGMSAAVAQTDDLPPGAKAPDEFSHVQLHTGVFVIDAAVAANPADRKQGLMYRTQLAPNEGMLFVYNVDAVHCFWMKNTPIPLSIAFMRADGTITDIDEMQAETTDSHCPSNNGVYALEMNQGWFEANGIRPGVKIEGLPQPQ